MEFSSLDVAGKMAYIVFLGGVRMWHDIATVLDVGRFFFSPLAGHSVCFRLSSSGGPVWTDQQ